MKQILQSLKTGECILEDVPAPLNSSHCLLVETSKTLVSAGTERMLMEFGKAGLLGKIKQQPDKVKMVLEKIKTDGLFATLDSVKAKLDQPIPLGYCNVGTVLEVGDKVVGFEVGDRVVSNGNHAEIVRVPQNLCAKIPDGVADEDAVFTVLASIALQGIRLAAPTLGERFVVLGLGLIGLIAVQILKANGCQVLGVDFDAKKCELAKTFGAEVVNLGNNEDPIAFAEHFSQGVGVDGVIITASTKSSEPLHQAATMCRKRGRVILIGVIGKEWSRADFYEKELSFQVSCSYGPGRYDERYEEKSIDYPLPYVRWTEQRNFEAILALMAEQKLDVKSLVSHHYTINQAQEVYQTLSSDRATLGIILDYPVRSEQNKLNTTVTLNQHQSAAQADVKVSFIGAGNYATRMLIPAFKQAKVKFDTIVSSGGISGKLAASKNDFSQSSTDQQHVYSNESQAVVIATRHDLHAGQVIAALQANKHVFVEKPLALTLKELEEIKTVYEQQQNTLLMVGFNRRFSPLVQKAKQLIDNIKSSKSFIMTVNAGFIPQDHWTQNAEVGGGRIIGEACHFVDLLRFLAGSPIIAYHALCNGIEKCVEDNAMITLKFADGSCGTIHYLANGHKSVSKERLEIFCEGKMLQLDNFRKLIGYGWKGFAKHKLRKQDKGQMACVQAFVDAINSGGVSPIAAQELFEVSEVVINIDQQLRKHREAVK